MVGGGLGCIARQAGTVINGHKALDLMSLHDGGVVRIRHHRVLRAGFVGVANHAEQAVRLNLPIHGEISIENLVPAMLAVGLGEHHQLDIGGVALELLKRADQVVDFIVGQGQTPAAVGVFQSSPPTHEHVHRLHGGRGLLMKKCFCGLRVFHDRLGHAIVQQAGDGLPLGLGQARRAEQALFQDHLVLRDTLNASQVQPAVVGDVRGLGRPGGHGAKTGSHHQRRSFA